MHFMAACIALFEKYTSLEQFLTKANHAVAI
jgi:hypothetical protein